MNEDKQSDDIKELTREVVEKVYEQFPLNDAESIKKRNEILAEGLEEIFNAISEKIFEPWINFKNSLAEDDEHSD